MKSTRCWQRPISKYVRVLFDTAHYRQGSDPVAAIRNAAAGLSCCTSGCQAGPAGHASAGLLLSVRRAGARARRSPGRLRGAGRDQFFGLGNRGARSRARSAARQGNQPRSTSGIWSRRCTRPSDATALKGGPTTDDDQRGTRGARRILVKGIHLRVQRVLRLMSLSRRRHPISRRTGSSSGDSRCTISSAER